jgi:peptide/nickel transport system substrate-binding protein
MNGEEDQKLANALVDLGMTRRGLAKFFGGASLVAATAGRLGSRTAAAQDERGGTLQAHLLAEPANIDPISAGQLDVFSHIAEPLAQLDLDNNIIGILAESWEISEDGLEYTFHLRQGLTFHDGTPFNADAVKFYFDRVLDPDVIVPFRSWVGPLRETVVVDDYTAKLVLDEPFSPLLGNIAMTWYGITSPASYQKGDDSWAVHPVGTGPFIFGEWVPGESLTITRNEAYANNPRTWAENKGAPYLDGAIFKIIPEPATALTAFEAGDIDELRNINARDFRRYEQDSNYQTFIQNGGTNVLYIEFSMHPLPEGQEFGAIFKAPFDDLRVRQAVGYGIDIDTIMAATTEGLAERNYGPMPTALWAYKPEIEEFGFHYDTAKASALLDEAGWIDSDGDGVREKDGKKLTLQFWASEFGDRDTVAQIAANQLNEIGFDVQVSVPEGGVYNEGLRKNESDLNFASFSVPEPDVIRLITNYDHCLGFYKDEMFQGYVADAMRTTDREARTAAYFEASKRMLADAAMIPFWTPLEFTTVRNAVKGYHTQLTYNHGIWEDVWIED